MLKITIIALGKFKEKPYKELESEYLKRLTPYGKIRIVELPEVPYRSEAEIEKVKKAEAEKIIGRLPKDGVVVLLEEKGVLRNSLDFSKFLERIGGLGREVVFVLGSGVGLDSSLNRYSHHSVSLSPLTFPHNMARVVLVEQIYRACTILAGKQYHK